MKTFSHLALTCLISAIAFYGALNLENPFRLFAAMVASAAWILFALSVIKRMRKDAARRFGERKFEEYMRSTSQSRMKF
jgi:hypothetical protein